MTTQPRWEDSGQGDLLSLVAMGSPSTGSADEEWRVFVRELQAEASRWSSSLIMPNDFRDRIRGKVKPQRVGAFTSRALAQGLIEYTGDWEISSDTTGRNSGKPCRTLRWIGGDF